MHVEMNVSGRGPRWLIRDRPGDDEWIDITEMHDQGERFIGRITGDTLEVRQEGRRRVAVRLPADPAPEKQPSAEVLDLMAVLKASLARRGGS